MIFAMILSAIAGALVPYAEPKIKQAINTVALMDLAIKDNEYDMLTVVVLIIAVAILCALFGQPAPAFIVGVFFGLGLFGKKIYAAIKASSNS